MAVIEIEEITGAGTDTEDLGIFDTLMKAIEDRINHQYEQNRITGKEYAQVYLGLVQSAMAESVKFTLGKQEADKRAELLSQQILSETKNNEDGGVIDLQKEKLQEEIDVAVAKTAEIYESILASQANTLRADTRNDEEVLQIQAKTDEIRESIIASEANTAREDAFNSERILHTQAQVNQIEENITASQANTLREDNESSEQVLQIQAQTNEVTASTIRQDEMHTKQLDKVDEEIDLLQSRDLEQIAATLRQDNESTKKQLLMDAQTIGFSSDTKQKVLKQLSEGYSVGLSIAGVGVLPDAYGDLTINGLTQNILDDVGATNIVVPRTPDSAP